MSDNPQEVSRMVKQTILSNIQALRLRGVLTKHFIKLKMPKEYYGKQVHEKNQDLNTNIVPLSLEVCFDDADPWTFLASYWIKASYIGEWAEQKIGKCVL